MIWDESDDIANKTEHRPSPRVDTATNDQDESKMRTFEFREKRKSFQEWEAIIIVTRYTNCATCFTQRIIDNERRRLLTKVIGTRTLFMDVEGVGAWTNVFTRDWFYVFLSFSQLRIAWICVLKSNLSLIISKSCGTVNSKFHQSIRWHRILSIRPSGTRFQLYHVPLWCGIYHTQRHLCNVRYNMCILMNYFLICGKK